MEVLRTRFPAWYISAVLAAYILPLPAHALFTLINLIGEDVFAVIAAFPGVFVVSAVLLFPYGCMYYAALTLVHTIADAILFRPAPYRMYACFLPASFVCSAVLMVSSILSMERLNHEEIYIILMLLSNLVIHCVTPVRFVIDLALRYIHSFDGHLSPNKSVSQKGC